MPNQLNNNHSYADLQTHLARLAVDSNGHAYLALCDLNPDGRTVVITGKNRLEPLASLLAPLASNEASLRVIDAEGAVDEVMGRLLMAANIDGRSLTAEERIKAIAEYITATRGDRAELDKARAKLAAKPDAAPKAERPEGDLLPDEGPWGVRECEPDAKGKKQWECFIRETGESVPLSIFGFLRDAKSDAKFWNAKDAATLDAEAGRRGREASAIAAVQAAVPKNEPVADDDKVWPVGTKVLVNGKPAEVTAPAAGASNVRFFDGSEAEVSNANIIPDNAATTDEGKWANDLEPGQSRPEARGPSDINGEPQGWVTLGNGHRAPIEARIPEAFGKLAQVPADAARGDGCVVALWGDTGPVMRHGVINKVWETGRVEVILDDAKIPVTFPPEYVRAYETAATEDEPAAEPVDWQEEAPPPADDREEPVTAEMVEEFKARAAGLGLEPVDVANIKARALPGTGKLVTLVRWQLRKLAFEVERAAKAAVSADDL